MEQLDYLIRTLTYRRSEMENNLKLLEVDLSSAEFTKIKGIVTGLSIAITEIYKLIQETDEEN